MNRFTLSSVCLSLILLMLYANDAHSQYANEWVKHSADYYRFSIETEGIYRIPYSVLAGTDLPLQGSGYQLWKQGEQRAVFVTTAQAFSQGDFIEFYGSPNDGQVDSELYDDPQWQLKPGRSLYQQAATYYLTWDDTEDNLRVHTTGTDLSDAPEPETYFWYENFAAFDGEYYRGKPDIFASQYIPEELLESDPEILYNSQWDVDWSNFAGMEDGEGYCSPTFSEGQTWSIGLQTQAAAMQEGLPDAILSIGLLGRSDNLSISPDHHYQVRWNDLVQDDFTQDGYHVLKYETSISNGQLQTINFLEVESIDDLGTDAEASLAYASIKYPRSFDLSGVASLAFTVDNSEVPRPLLKFNNFSSSLQFPILYDLSTNERFFGLNLNDEIHFRLSENDQSHELYLQRIENIQNVTQLEPVDFVNHEFSANQGDYLIIYPELLQASAIAIGLYRTSVVGGSHTALLCEVSDLYHQFSYGIEGHPQAIRNFLAYALAHFDDKPKNVLLLGTGVDLFHLNQNPGLAGDNRLPAIGSPSSDFLFLRDNNGELLDLALGRLPIKTDLEGENYLDKVKTFEEQTRACERSAYSYRGKQILLGQLSNQESEVWTQDWYSQLTESASNSLFESQSAVWIEETDQDQAATFVGLSDSLQAGAGIVLYTGESQDDGSWWNIDDPTSATAWQNGSNYSFVVSASDYTADVFSGQAQEKISAELLLDASHGAVVFWGSADRSSYNATRKLSADLLAELYDSQVGEAAGAIWYSILNSNIGTEDEHLKRTLETWSLLGDPAICFSDAAAPDYTILEQTDVWFEPIVGAGGVQSVDMYYRISNIGFPQSQEVNVSIYRDSESGDEMMYDGEKTFMQGEDNVYLFSFDVTEDLIGLNELSIIIDEQQVQEELCYENNRSVRSLFINDLECSDELVQIENLQSSYCFSNSPSELIGSPAGGTFYIDGEASGIIDPLTLGAGQHDIQYVIVAEEPGCPDTIFEDSFHVTEGPAAIFELSQSQTCLYDEVEITYLGNASSEASYTWNFGPGAVGGDVQGPGPHQVVWTSAGSKSISLIVADEACLGSYARNMEVFPAVLEPELECTEVNVNSVTVSWSAQSYAEAYSLKVNELEIDLDAEATSYTADNLELGDEIDFVLTAVGNEECGNLDSEPLTCIAEGCIEQSLFIAQLPEAVCLFDPPFQISASPLGGVFSGNGVSGDFYNPLLAGAGLDTIKYTYIEGDCEYFIEAEIEIREDPVPAITQIGDLCVDDEVTLEVTEGYSAYQWVTNEQLGQSIQVGEAGQYNVVVTDEVGCQGAAFSFVAAAGIEAEIYSNTDAFVYCEDQASIFLNVSTFEEDVSVEWQDGTVGPLEVTNSGEYTALLSQPNGCTDELSVWVEEVLAPQPSLITDTGELAICNDQPLTVTCPEDYTKYEWFQDSNLLDYPEDQNSIVVEEPGSFLLVVTNEFGCVGSFFAVVEGGGALQPTILAPDASSLCEGTNVTLQLDQVYESYVWSTSEVSPSIQVSTSGTYTVYVESAGGCEGQSSTELVFQSTPTVNLGPNTDIQSGNTFTLDPVLSEGDYSYIWSTGSTSPTITVQESGLYSVEVTDLGTGCSASDEVQLSFVTSNQEPGEKLWRVSPTITWDRVLLELKVDNLWDFKIELVDIFGHVLLQSSFNSSFQEVSLAELPAGVYLILLRDGQGLAATQKLIKQ